MGAQSRYLTWLWGRWAGRLPGGGDDRAELGIRNAECQGLEGKSMAYSRNLCTQGKLCQSRMQTSPRGPREPRRAAGGRVARAPSNLVSVTISVDEPELVTAVCASVSLYVKWEVRSRRDQAVQMFCALLELWVTFSDLMINSGLFGVMSSCLAGIPAEDSAGFIPILMVNKCLSSSGVLS